MKNVGKKALGIGMAAVLTLGTGMSALAYEDIMPVTGTPPYIMNFDAAGLLEQLMDENGDIDFALPVEDGDTSAQIVLAAKDMPEGLRTLTFSAFGTVLHVPDAVFAGLPVGASLQFSLEKGAFTFMLADENGDEYVWRDKVNTITAELPFTAPMDISTHQIVLQSNGSFAVARSWLEDGKVMAALNQSGTFKPAIADSGNYADTEKRWMGTAVFYLAARGVIKGETEITFAPYDNVTREDFYDMLIQTLGAVPVMEEGQHGEDPISRMEMFMLAHGAMENCGLMPQVFTMQWLAFPDWPDALEGSDASALQNLGKLGLMRGDTQGYLRLDAHATRAEAAQVLYNVLTFLAK